MNNLVASLKKIITNKNTVTIPVDQFAGSGHWEIFSVFEK